VVSATRGALKEGASLDDAGTDRIRDTRFWEYFFPSVKKSFISKALPPSS
jgi:hypothetical protein